MPFACWRAFRWTLAPGNAGCRSVGVPVCHLAHVSVVLWPDIQSGGEGPLPEKRFPSYCNHIRTVTQSRSETGTTRTLFCDSGPLLTEQKLVSPPLPSALQVAKHFPSHASCGQQNPHSELGVNSEYGVKLSSDCVSAPHPSAQDSALRVLFLPVHQILPTFGFVVGTISEASEKVKRQGFSQTTL